ncbi:hypothetical protein EBZ35_07815, partial [bacterium]|nr:hypothetical protein [bacterium]
TVTIKSVKHRQSHDQRRSFELLGNVFTIGDQSQTETFTQASLQSGGSMMVDGNQGVGLTSAQIEMGKGGLIQSEKGKVESSVLMLESRNEYQRGDRHHVDFQATGVANTITAGENGLAIQAKGDIDLKGIKIKTPGAVALQSETGDISMTGITNTRYSMDHREWQSSSWFGAVTTRHVEHQESLNQSLDRTTIEAGQYSAQAAPDRDVVREGTSVVAGTIYESGHQNHEKTSRLLSYQHSSSRENSGLNLGILKIDNIEARESDLASRAIKNEVNENLVSGTIVKSFTGAVTLEGSTLYSEKGSIHIKGSDVTLAAVKDSIDVVSTKKQMRFEGVQLDLNPFDDGRVGSSTQYKGTTDTSHTYDETARGVVLSGEGVVIESSNTVSGDGVEIESRNGKMDIKGKNGVFFTDATEVHQSVQGHSEDKLTVTGYIGNKWYQTAQSAYQAVSDAVDGSGTVTKGVKGAAAVGRMTKEIGGSATTAATLGFYAGVEVSLERQRQQTDSESVISRGPRLRSNAGVSIESEAGDILIKGGRVVNTAGDVSFKVSKENKINLINSNDRHLSHNTSQTTRDQVNAETNLMGYVEIGGSHSQSDAAGNDSLSQVNQTV